MFAVSASSGRYARVLARSADEQMDFASAALLRPTKGGTLYEAKEHMIEAHSTRFVYMQLGPEGHNVDAEFTVTNVKSPILCVGILVKQGDWFEAGPTLGAKCPKGIAAWRWTSELTRG